MTRRVALCFATLLGSDFFELVNAAEHAGFSAVTVSPDQYATARAQGHSDRTMRRALDAAGIDVAVVDPLVGVLPAGPNASVLSPDVRRLLGYAEDEVLRAAVALGAPVVNVAHPLGGFVPLPVLVDVLGGLTERARQHGLCIAVEFTPSSAAIPDAARAQELVDAVGLDGLGLTFDTWHDFRGPRKDGEPLGFRPSTLLSLQVNDAPASVRGLPPQPGEDRLLPGDGAIGLRDLLGPILSQRPDLVVGVEVPSTALRALPPVEAAAAAFAALLSVL